MNPAIGRFVTMDTFAGRNRDPYSLHKYLYAHANPVTYIDPSGYNTATYEEVMIVGAEIAKLAATIGAKIYTVTKVLLTVGVMSVVLTGDTAMPMPMSLDQRLAKAAAGAIAEVISKTKSPKGWYYRGLSEEDWEEMWKYYLIRARGVRKVFKLISSENAAETYVRFQATRLSDKNSSWFKRLAKKHREGSKYSPFVGVTGPDTPEIAEDFATSPPNSDDPDAPKPSGVVAHIYTKRAIQNPFNTATEGLCENEYLIPVAVLYAVEIKGFYWVD